MGGNHGGGGCVPLSRSIVDEIVSLSYIIPKWILTTFKDWTDGVPPGSEIIHTTYSPVYSKYSSCITQHKLQQAELALNRLYRTLLSRI